MKQMKNWNTIVFLMLMMSLITSCSKDNDSTTDINNYIVGKWHTFYHEEVVDDKQTAYEITVTDKNLYEEIIFNNDNTMTLGCWHIDHKGEYYWDEITYRYSIKNNKINIIFNDGSSYDVNDLVYDSKQKTLCLHKRYPIEYLTIPGIYLYKDHYIYFKK